MRIDIITVLPELLESPFNASILKRAQEKGLVEVVVHNLRDYSTNKQKSVDDYAFGGGAGMVLQIQPIADCIEKLTVERTYDQKIANQLSLYKNIIILAGHYKGIDERLRDLYITKEISVGDYVLTGGELPAAMVCDAIIRLIPGVISDETSALTDSFQDGLLSPPVYTRPEDYKGMKVPKILLSGDHKKIEQWREKQAYKRTKERRPDLLD